MLREIWQIYLHWHLNVSFKPYERCRILLLDKDDCNGRFACSRCGGKSCERRGCLGTCCRCWGKSDKYNLHWHLNVSCKPYERRSSWCLRLVGGWYNDEVEILSPPRWLSLDRQTLEEESTEYYSCRLYTPSFLQSLEHSLLDLGKVKWVY